MEFQKGKLYMLRSLSKNIRWNAMTIIRGTLYLAEEHRSTVTGSCFRDGDMFVCLEDSPEFDVDAYRATMSPNTLENTQLTRTAEAKQQYDFHRKVSFLTPTGVRAEMRVKGNKTKFKEVTSRTRVK
jgi:hypothetical protein